MGTTSFDSYFTGLRARLRTRITAIVGVFLMATSSVIAVSAQTANAVTSDVLVGFELEGNMATQAPTNFDWQNVLGTCSQAPLAGKQDCPSNVLWERDAHPPLPGKDDTFTVGAKDILDVNPTGWFWKDFSSPDKDDLTDVFATVRDGKIYLGAVRYANNGSAYVGFWLFKNAVASKCASSVAGNVFVDAKFPVPSGTPGSVTCDLSTPSSEITPGLSYPLLKHAIGDVLVLINYEQGGSTTVPLVYAWDPTVTNYLRQVAPDPSIPAVDCKESLTPAQVCSTTNVGAIPALAGAAGWGYQPKTGPADTIPPFSFFEAGITQELFSQGLDPCFSSVLGETRSSPETTAALKDFAGGSFQPCKLSVDKTGPSIGKIGSDPSDKLDYTVTITNEGTITLYRQTINDSIAGNLLGSPNAGVTNVVSGCGVSLAPGANCTITYSYQPKSGDPDPLVNTVTATYNALSDLSGTQLVDTDSHNVNLFQPSVALDESCDDLSKVGDPYTCTVTVTNTSSADSPPLTFDSDPTKGLVDSKAGDLLRTLNAGYTLESRTCLPTTSLAPGNTCTVVFSHVVESGEPDTIVHAASTLTHPTGFTNNIGATDGDSVNLFQPSLAVDKTCDPLSKVGDPYTCTVTVTNTSSPDSPNLTFDSDPTKGLVDTLAGDLLRTLNAGYTLVSPTRTCLPATSLAPGASCTVTYTHTVVPGDPDPIDNTASAWMHPVGFPNDIKGSDSASINLFQPSLSVVEACDDLSKVTDPYTCTVTVTNTSSADSPNLTFDADPTKGLVDNRAGDLLRTLNAGYTLDSRTCVPATSLASGASCTVVFTHVVQPGEPDPIIHNLTVLMHPAGFPNNIGGSGTQSVNLFQPSLVVDKTCDDLSKVGDDVSCTVTMTNTSSADSPNLILDSINDTKVGNLNGVLSRGTKTLCPPFPGGGLAPGATWSCTYSFTVLSTDPDPLVNSVIAYTHPSGFPNVIWDDASDSINLFQPSLALDKSCDDVSKIGDPYTCTVTVTNTSSADSPNLAFDANPTKGLVDTLAGDLLRTLNAGYTLDSRTCVPATSLAPGASCTVTYTHIVVLGEPDPIVNTASAWMHPVGFPNDIKASDSETINLFQPSLSVDYACDDLSKVTDPYTCTVTVTNTSSSDSPNLTFDSDPTKGLVDSRAGDLLRTLNAGYTLVSRTCLPATSLASGASCTVVFSHVVQPGEPDPIIHNLTVLMHPTGFPNNIGGSGTQSVNLFQPSLSVDKQGSITTGLVGDTVTYTVTVTNTGSSDSPNLTFDADPTKGLVDTKAGDLLRTLNAGYTLVSRTCLPATSLTVSPAAGSSCQVVFSHVITSTDPDPLTNVASAWMHPVGFPNDVKGSDDWSVDVIHPDFSIEKQCTGNTAVPMGGTAIFDITIRNTGDVEIPANSITVSDPAAVSGKYKGSPITFPFLIPDAIPVGQPVYITDVAVPATTVNLGPDGKILNTTRGSFSYFGRPPIVKEAQASCPVTADGATRTPGFWQTHVSYTTHIFRDALGSRIDLGWRVLTTKEQVFGMFWASNSRQSNGTRRDSVCQARVIGSFQLLAAILNTGLSNGAPVPVDTVTGNSIIVAMRAALAAGNVQEIKRLQGLLDAYNNHGDAVAIVDNWGVIPGNASPSTARSLSDYTIADC